METKPVHFLLIWRTWLPQSFLIAGLTFWIYWPALRGDFIWDDIWYIKTNSLLHQPDSLWKFWFLPENWVEYYPISETVRWIQWQMWGENTLGYHLTNIVLHLLNALLVWRLLAKFGLPLAWEGGLLFAVHPAQVESVAWISELKNTFSLPFFLLAMCSWIDYEHHHRKQDFLMALGLFLAAMLCKISMAPFPFIILLYAWWKRGRVTLADLKTTVPFFLISLALGIATITLGALYLEKTHGMPVHIQMGGFFEQIGGMGVIFAAYFSRTFLALGDLLSYPQWHLNSNRWLGYIPWLAFLGAAGWIWTKRHTWGRHVLLGFGFFLLTLAPFLGVVGASYMRFTWEMDHFLYIPLIGIIGLVVAGLGDLTTKLPSAARLGLTGIMAILIIAMTAESRADASHFLSDETFWAHVLQRNPDGWIPHHNLGFDLLNQKHYPEAIAHLNEAIRVKPDSDEDHYNLGVALDQTGHTAQAQAEYQQTIALNPRYESAYRNLAVIEQQKGNLASAEDLLNHALALDPDYSAAQIDLANIKLQTGHPDQAIPLYESAVQAKPNLPQLHFSLGLALLQTGRLPEAIEQLQAAVKLDSTVAVVHGNLGTALAQSGQLPAAITELKAALAIDPHYQEARDNLGLALALTGHRDQAIDQFELALKVNPNDTNARESLSKLRDFQKASKYPPLPPAPKGTSDNSDQP
jgi:tetratricopeptide (TPR) repeat protein